MPTIDISLPRLKELIGEDIGIDEIEELLNTYAKAEVEDVEDDKVKVEIADGNRPDLWSIEGLARVLRKVRGSEEGIASYGVKDSEVEVEVSSGIKDVRPFIACAVIKDVDLSNADVKSLVQTQEKIDMTYGRSRKRSSIGLYNLDEISPPVSYKLVDPSSVSFVPLDFNEELNLKEIIKEHPKGEEYGHIISDFDKFPILIDSKDDILSLPPIINSKKVGSIDEDTENIFLEVTGTDYETVINTLNVFCMNLHDLGGELNSVKINYPDREDILPSFESRRYEVKLSYILDKIGLEIKPSRIKELLRKMGYEVINVDESSNKIVLNVPFYRKDVMHPMDVVEDIVIAYDYNEIDPVEPEIPTKGSLLEGTKSTQNVKDIMVGLGCQEVKSFYLTNKEKLLKNLELDEGEVVEIENPVSVKYTVLRNSIIPSLLNFASENKTVEFPQKVFEIGPVFEVKGSSPENHINLAFSITHSSANFNEAKSHLTSLFELLGVNYELEDNDSPIFIEGRSGSILVDDEEVGVLGEVNPKVLDNFGLKNPMSVFEINFSKLSELRGN